MATPRFTLIRVQRPTGPLDEAPWRNIDQNFEALKAALERAITAGTLLSLAQRQLVGDVTGYIGSDQTTTVEKIRNVTIPAPAAGDDGKAITYNHGGTAFTYTDKLSDVFTTRGDLLYRGASAESRLAIGAANTLLKSDGTDPSWSTLTAMLDSISSTQGEILYRGAATWAALGTGTSGNVLKTQGAGANPAWGTLAFTNLSDVPSSYTSQALKALRVNAGATAVEFFTQAFTLLSDVPSSYTGHGGKVVKVKVDESGLEFVTSGAGVTNFTDLGDVPASYAGSGGYFVKVNAGATGLEFSASSSSSPLTTKGDIYVYATGDTRLAVGANYKVLQADSAETPGLKWVDASEMLDDGIGSTRGSVLYRGASGWAILTPGTATYVLTSNGAGADPSWQAVSAGAHNLLSASHGDTTAASVTRGDIIAGIGSTPKWERVAKGSRSNVLGMNDNEPTWLDHRRFHLWLPRIIQAWVGWTKDGVALSAFSAITTAGTGSSSSDTTRGGIKWTNGTTTACGWQTTNANRFDASLNPHARFDSKLVDEVNGCWWGGFFSSLGSTTAADPAGHFAAFRYRNGTDTNFQACVKDGTTIAVTDTGVAFDNGWHDFEVYTFDGGVTWLFYIDGVLVATHTTNVPTTTQSLGFMNYLSAISSSAREHRASYGHVTSGVTGSL